MITIVVEDSVTGQKAISTVPGNDVELWINYWCYRAMSSDMNRSLLFGFSGDEPEWDTYGKPNRFRVLKIEKNGHPVKFPECINDTDNAPPLPWL